jgi:hypothetical protein
MNAAIKPLTKAQQRALALIRAAPLKRNNTGWISEGARQFVPVLVVKKLIRAGLVKLSRDRRSVHATVDPLSVCPGCGCYRDRCACDLRESAAALQNRENDHG